jgi:hypothetical protein
MPSPFGIAEPDLGPLHQALAKCGIAGEQVSRVAARLSRPPLSLGQSLTDDPEIFSGKEFQIGTGEELGRLILRPREFDRDMAAFLLCLNEGHPEPRANWKALSRAERKRAERLWNWTGKAHGLSVTPQGRPPAIDPALVLYCMCVLCEATDSPRFRFSRIGDKITGPMWRALIVGLQLAQLFLARRFGTPAVGRINRTRHDLRIDSRFEAIMEIVRATRSPTFKQLCETLKLRLTSDDIAARCNELRVTIAYARRSRSQKKRRLPARR